MVRRTMASRFGERPRRRRASSTCSAGGGRPGCSCRTGPSWWSRGPPPSGLDDASSLPARTRKRSMSIGGGASSTPLRPELLLKPEDALLLGQVHRLVTSQEVTKAIQAWRQDKARRCKEAAPDDRRPPPQPGPAVAAGQASARVRLARSLVPCLAFAF
ncbi:hypothetical protein PVAP13_5NG442701 [Panicum virgatum]|uniref:Uncharacterized protein n=1 Tax=Panicum virgatum TaxID=38727 RepID=A0A8T0S3Y4_PANVG|nr:hypothetical protein PVAP13_5NG442701 [Panicum virgatum]